MLNDDLLTIRDPSRLAALAALDLLDSPPEPAFDTLTRIAAKSLRAPIAIICLVDAERQFFKSAFGLPQPWALRRGTPLTHSFCQFVVTFGQPLLVSDARLNSLLHQNLAIPELGIVAYVGIPIVSHDGHTLGSFCVADCVPRVWSDEEISLLQDLADCVMLEIEQRRKLAERVQFEEVLQALNAELETQVDTLVSALSIKLGEDMPPSQNPQFELDLARRHFQVKGVNVNYRTLVEQLPAVVYINDLGSVCSMLYASPQIESILGYSAAECMADPFIWDKIIHPDDHGWVQEKCDEANDAGEPLRLEYRMVTKDGRIVWIRDEAVLIYDSEGQPRCRQGILSDITVRRLLESQLTHQAFHDPLTDLPNRSLCLDRLQQALVRAENCNRPVAALFLDLDNFKQVNDGLGHQAGDQVLTVVAQRLQNCIRPEDTVARLGGDEFVILLDGVDGEQDAIVVAQRILAALAEPIVLQQEVWITCSIGIALAVADQASEAFLENADAAMYEAKTKGKNQYAMFMPGTHRLRQHI
ncbi:diguanylate cyclase [Romeria aff. gracilis LEGE 07310]|uniref:Diguanylate cyclase n=1 Tax=Vasconcelosia minhoensis LEGE 07310 TaxID=915328 RepID=A0A8J7DER6_9CYAN|nr:diguanylate cyclase [Romeria gracilis]MBE9080003.1 diguanylate cyclase [Romeria aff. gracilis LEGE 07310]